ncbi:MAG: T9SS type A sorting domain-containing protein [Flavobacteriales bacterium]|nr:T9SS type A sorting domain-containing protein [Flavobacteriales bacterium]
MSGSPAGGVFIGPGVSGNTFDPLAAGVGTHSIQYVHVDVNNCVNAAGQCTEVTLNAGTGGNNMAANGVWVFPNPNRGQFTVEVELTGLVSMQVFDARGRQVHNEVFQANGGKTQRTLDLSGLATGSYTVQVRNAGAVVTQQVVVE